MTETAEVEAEVIDLPTQPETALEFTYPQAMARITELETQLAQAGQTMSEFKARVRSEAMAMAQAHNLCSVVEQTLHKVGIDNVRRRVQVTYTFRRTVAYDVPEELITLVKADQFISWATTGRAPQGLSNREFRAIRALGMEETPAGEAEMVVSDPRTAASVLHPMGNVVPPHDHLAAYSSDDGRVVHFIPIGSRSIDTDRYGVYTGFNNATALCGHFGYWRNSSRRAETPPRVCGRCAR